MWIMLDSFLNSEYLNLDIGAARVNWTHLLSPHYNHAQGQENPSFAV